QARGGTAGPLLAVIARILVLDRDHAVIARLPERTQEPHPGRIVLALAAGDEMPRRLRRIRRGEMQDTLLLDAIGIELGVLAVGMADFLYPSRDHRDRI